MKEASHQKIQIYPVKPIVDCNNEDDVRHFEHSRSFKKDESETESKNSIEQRWVERRIFTTTDSFPSISTSNRIVNVKSIILRPVSPTWIFNWSQILPNQSEFHGLVIFENSHGTYLNLSAG